MEGSSSPHSRNSSCLKIAVADDIIFFNVRRKPLRIGGVLVEVFDTISKYMGVCHEWVLPSDGLYGYELPNGTWTGMLGLVNRSEADMAGIISIIPRYMRAVDVSEPLYMDEYSIMYERPALQSDIMGFFKPFTPLIWVVLFACVLLMITITAVILYWDPVVTEGDADRDPRHRLLRAGGKSVLWNFSQMLSQTVPWEPRGNPGRVVGGVWLLSALILGAVYRSNLKAMLILPRIVLPFDNLKELSQSGITLYVTKGNYFYDNIKNSPPDSVVGSLNKQLEAHEDIPRALGDILSGKMAGAGPKANIAIVMHGVFSRTGKCPLYQISEGFMKSTSRSITIRKGAPFKPQVDRVIRGLKEFGILDHLYRKATVNATECLKPVTLDVGSDTLRSLSLGDFYGVFAIYAVGIIMGCMMFMMEVCVHVTRKNQRRRSDRPHLMHHST